MPAQGRRSDISPFSNSISLSFFNHINLKKMKRTAIFLNVLLLCTAMRAQKKEEETKDSFYILSPVEVKAVRASELSPFTKINLSKKEIAKTNLGQDIPFIL